LDTSFYLFWCRLRVELLGHVFSFSRNCQILFESACTI
jgi:hypothetical protein